MIFCFVRETKQLTLEELDRKLKPHPTHVAFPHIFCRGLLGPNKGLYPPRDDRVASLFYQTTHLPSEYREATADHCGSRQSCGHPCGIMCIDISLA